MAAQAFLLIASFLLVLFVLARPLGTGLARLINNVPLPGTGSVEKGIFEAYDNNKYGSGMIKPLVNSNSILISDEKKEIFEAGEEMKVLTFQPFFSLERAIFKN